MKAARVKRRPSKMARDEAQKHLDPDILFPSKYDARVCEVIL